MNLPSSTKTEHRALNALERIIDKHPTMDYLFNGNDKEMSWDGHIWLYKRNNGEQTKSNFDGRVPVQIKGHYDQKLKYHGKKSITYQVELDDLRAYSTEKGVLYFQIFIHGERSDIYYASLFPSKIADYLETASDKGNKKALNLQFNHLEENETTLFNIAKQFDFEAKIQGTAFTPLVQDRIRSDEFSKLSEIHANIFGANDILSAIRRLSSGDVCLKGKTSDNPYERPIQWRDHSKFFAAKEVHQPISIGDDIFYSKYRCIADSDGGMIVKPSPNLDIHLSEGTCVLKSVSCIEELNRDASFLLSIKDVGAFCIANQVFRFVDLTISKEFEEGLRYYKDLYIAMKMIGLDVRVSVSTYTEKQKKQLARLVDIYRGAVNDKLSGPICKYTWQFGDKYVPLLVVRSENGKNDFISSVYTDKMAVFLPYEKDGREDGYRMPLFLYQDKDILSNLFYYDFDAFKAQIDASDFNSVTSDVMNENVLKLINVFDNNNDDRFLQLADYLLDKLAPFGDCHIVLLNKLQIKKRRGLLDSRDIESLKDINSNSDAVLFGKYVLLGDKEKAGHYYQLFSDEMKEQFKKYPIYKLYSELT